MSPLLKSVYGTEGGSEALDVLMKYMYVSSTDCQHTKGREKAGQS